MQLATPTKQEKREYVLEVIGLGVTLDKYRQGKLWEALQKGNAYASIREQDKEKYPWDAMERSGMSGGRSGAGKWRQVHPYVFRRARVERGTTYLQLTHAGPPRCAGNRFGRWRRTLRPALASVHCRSAPLQRASGYPCRSTRNN
ncbi:type VI lipase adapter Tla3 domain-containing protein [Janthinobacterium sp. ROICE36]|uniref:type VI lipase adapter Tla3 domain-containing protein n=1 Tax=Janthinobacterium sp. ROICE36 TaxID=2048670 RepID=UPI0015E088EB